MRTKYWTTITYPESMQQPIEKLEQMLEYARCKYAVILHDSDVYEEDNTETGTAAGELKKPHYHWCIEFPTPHEEAYVNVVFSVAKSIPMRYDKVLSYRYLLHLDHPEKFQYPLSSVRANFNAADGMRLDGEEANMQTFLLDDILEIVHGCLSYHQFYERHPEWIARASTITHLVRQYQSCRDVWIADEKERKWAKDKAEMEALMRQWDEKQNELKRRHDVENITKKHERRIHDVSEF